MSLSLNKTRASDTGRQGLRCWAARLGVVAFLFFLVKGLAWLAVGAAVAWAAVGTGQQEQGGGQPDLEAAAQGATP